MSLSEKERQHHERLKKELQQGGNASNLEHLAAALLSRLLDVPIVVSRSGFQHGGDAGTAGQQGRRLRIECKKYSDTSSLNERELLGEIDQALERDQALEAWILVATRTVPEQLQQSLVLKGERDGVPIVIIGWLDHEIAPLAALCAFAPDLVEKEFSKEAGEAARALQLISKQAIERLRRELQSWCLGYDALRALSHEDLDKIWYLPRESNAKIGQDAAGGAQEKKVKRSTVHEALNTWWHGSTKSNAPVAVVGLEGTGKTWATLHWLIDKKYEQPIVLIIPSSAVAAIGNVSETSVKQLLSDRLHEISGIRDREHWLRRLENLLKRPTNEGPVLTVFFDGLNQEPSIQWLHILKILQGETFKERVRIIVSTRTHYYEDRLSEFRGLEDSAERVDVGPYDTAPRSELDQMLAFEDLTQDDLHCDVIELARNPRLFKLVVRFRENLVKAGQITVHRLLWEYGRDFFGIRAGKSFSENEWRDWLKEIAQQHRNGIATYSEKELVETVTRSDLEKKEVYARLSDIIDGRFATRDSSGLQITPAVVAHALGAALLNDLNQEDSPTFETLNTRLAEWFDPISGLDERAEILRAAVSILVEQKRAPDSLVPGVLVTAWLQSQNVPHEHCEELAYLAPNIPDALLDAIEHSDSYVHDSARFWAVYALRNIPTDDTTAFTKIIKRTRRWMSMVSRDVDTHRHANEERHKRRLDRLKRLIGVDASQRIKVVGVELELVDSVSWALLSTVPSIIEVFPLAEALPIFEVAAIALAVKGQSESWDGLKWICLLNEIDPDDTVKALRKLSKEVRRRTPEPGIHSDLPRRVAELLLRLTGHKADEDKAVAIAPDLDRPLSYEKDYLRKPSQSWFPLERRHAEIVLADPELSLVSRAQRTADLWLDPNFKPPATFVAELRKTAERIDVEKLDRAMGLTSEDYDFERLEPVLARCAPDLLADLIRRKMQNLSTCPPEFRQLRSSRATHHFILAGKAEMAAARTLRLSDSDNDKDEEDFVAHDLLLMEVSDLDAQTQLDILIGADLKFISADFENVLTIPKPDDVDALVVRYADSLPKQQHDLLMLLSRDRDRIELKDNAWSWVEGFLKHQDHDLRRLAFRILACADPMRFGQILDAEGWSWSPSENVDVNHSGTQALIEATADMPFEVLAPRLAPWHLLKATRLREDIPTEVRLAAKIFDPKLVSENIRIDAKAFKPFLIYAMDIVEQWLENYYEIMMEVSQCSPSAEKFFLVLCEALLIHAPEKGAQLWQALRSTMITRYIGVAGVENLMHMVFSAPDSPEVMKLREELVELEYCHNDQKLLELAIAASYNGKSDWLDTFIQNERASTLVWRQRRAEVLAGFTTNNSLPVAGAWPDGEIRTTHAKFALRSARYRWIEACAHHWWRTFLNAGDPAEAYAAWILFLRSADRRAWVWMNQDIKNTDDSTDFFQRKIKHLRLNQSKIEQAMKKREEKPGDKLAQLFLFQKTVRSLGPWFGR